MKLAASVIKFLSLSWISRRIGSCPSRKLTRPPGTIQVFRDNQLPHNPFKEIAVLSGDGHPFEHDDIEADFIKKARALGGDALVLLPPVKSIQAPAGWDVFDTFRFLAAVVVYEKNAGSNVPALA